MITRLMIISFLVLAMIATREATDNIRSHAGLEQKLRSIQKFERDTRQTFIRAPWVPPMEKNFYFEETKPQSTEL